MFPLIPGQYDKTKTQERVGESHLFGVIMILYMQYLRVDSCCGLMLFQAAVRIICVFQVLCDIWCYFRCYFHCIVLQLAGVS